MCGLFMNGKMMAKKNKIGYVRVELVDLDTYEFYDMSFFNKWVPENCELTYVRFYHDFGYYDESDTACILINWREKDDGNN